MGTNASKKFASKIVAVLLAALMLVSVLPMTAFAGSVLDPDYVVTGLSLINEPKTEYDVNDTFDFDGLKLQMTVQSIKEIEADGSADKASKAYVTLTVNGTAVAQTGDMTGSFDDVEDAFNYWGLGCEFADGRDLEQGQVLTIADNLENIVFTYGKNSENKFDTGIKLFVEPNLWESGYEATDLFKLSSSAQYVILVDGEMVSSREADKDHIGTKLSYNPVALYEGIEVNGTVIADFNKQLEKINAKYFADKADYLEIEEVLWKLDDLSVVDAKEGIVSLTPNATLDNAKAYLDASDVTGKVANGAWPVLISDAAVTENVEKAEKNPVNFTTWNLNEKGQLYITYKVQNGEIKQANGTTEPTYETVTLYFAVNEAGYGYIETKAENAAKVALYEVTTAYVDDIEIAKNPDKMSYVEGEKFDGKGMVVNLINDDKIVACIPYELFEQYGIGCNYTGRTLTVKNDDDQKFTVYYNGYKDDCDKALEVTAKAKNEYSLLTGKLLDGTYVIANLDREVDLTVKGQYVDMAIITSDIQSRFRTEYVNGKDNDSVASTFEISTLDAGYITVYNGKIVENVDLSDAWNIKFDVNERAYTIQNAVSGKYLNRHTLTYTELWVDGYNTTADKIADADAIIAKFNTLVLGDLCADSYWKIDGGYDTSIESDATIDTKDNFYLQLAAGLKGDAFIAVEMSGAPESMTDGFYFFKTETNEIVAAQILDQAGLHDAKFASGDKLDLHDMVVELTYTNGTTVKVPYDSFASYGITTNYADGQILAGSDNGKNLTITVNGITITGAALNVEDSKAEVVNVRLGGADRYATAALIANSYVTALGENYKNVAVLTSGVNYPDALAGGTLAYALNAPIVLTTANVLPTATKTFLTENKVASVYVIGGESAVSAAVRAELKAMGIAITAVEGTNRVETSVAVAKQLAAVKGYSDTIILTNGANFADALSVSSAAAIKGIPVVYVTNGLADSVKSFIDEAKATKAIILGGEAAVAADIETAVETLGLSVERVAGDTRYETGVAIAEYFADVYTGKAVAFATGKDFPDALAGSPFAAFVGAPVVLLDNGYVNAAAAEYAAGLDLTNVYVFGGPDALSDATVNATLLK